MQKELEHLYSKDTNERNCLQFSLCFNQFTLFQNGRHFSILLFTCKLALFDHCWWISLCTAQARQGCGGAGGGGANSVWQMEKCVCL